MGGGGGWGRRRLRVRVNVFGAGVASSSGMLGLVAGGTKIVEIAGGPIVNANSKMLIYGVGAAIVVVLLVIFATN